MGKILNFKVRGEEQGERIDKLVSNFIPSLSRTRIQSLIREGKVRVNGNPVQPSHRVREGEEIEVTIPPSPSPLLHPEPRFLEVIYEDEHLLVINKEAGIVVHPGGGKYSHTLVNALLHHCGENLSTINGPLRPGIVHRLDKETSGVLVVAKDNSTHLHLAAQFRNRRIKKEYLALVRGKVKIEEGEVHLPIGRNPFHRERMGITYFQGKEAITHFETLREYEDCSLLRLSLKTGRTHQIRLHLASIGHPVLGDKVYGKKGGNKEKIPSRHLLHAWKIGFIHPSLKEYMEFTAPLPSDMKAWVEGVNL